MSSANLLHREINARALAYASAQGLLYESTGGTNPSLLFGANEQGYHGNFHPESYRAILANPQWARRLAKAHTAYRRHRLRSNWNWRELDAAASSDALLMNIFCHPGALESVRLRSLLGIESHCDAPEFGVRPRVPLLPRSHSAEKPSARRKQAPAFDTTETDLLWSGMLLEAKLTESSFQTASPHLVHRYRDLDAIFFVEELPLTRKIIVDTQWDDAEEMLIPVSRGSSGNYMHYQLLRGALAAHATGLRFAVASDSRRPDLMEAWHLVQRAVRSAELRSRLQFVTWQEIAGAAPSDLQVFLAEKYGILPV